MGKKERKLTEAVEKEARNTLKSVERALQILEAFTIDHPEYSADELSQKVSLPKGSIYRFLRVLTRRGFLERNPQSKKFRLGIKVFELGSLVWKDMDLRKLALPGIEKLSQKSGETVHLGVLSDNEVVSIEEIESGQSLRISIPIGKRVCLHSTGIGKAILAFLSDEEIESVIRDKGLPRFTSNTITDPILLKEEISKIRKLGYALDNEENEVGIRCVAAPIYNYLGKVVASISISGPAIRITEDRIPHLAEMVKEITFQISRSLGYSPHQ